MTTDARPAAFTSMAFQLPGAPMSFNRTSPLRAPEDEQPRFTCMDLCATLGEVIDKICCCCRSGYQRLPADEYT